MYRKKLVYPSLSKWLLLCLLIPLGSACTRERLQVEPDNNAPWYGNVPTILVENYVNRVFIDLLGREPVDSEMIVHVQYLRAGDLSKARRTDWIRMLQTDTVPAAGDSSYQSVYYRRFYEMTKVRLLEGVSDSYLLGQIGILRFGIQVDSLNGDTTAVNKKRGDVARYERIMQSEYDYRYGRVTLDSVCARMVDNPVYDFINMNSFNFINATFDNLYFRFPTQNELERAYVMVDASQPSTLFGRPGSNKSDYIQIVVAQREFWQGWVVWAYKTLLARDPTTSELYSAQLQLNADRNFHATLLNILISDEYAHFNP
ncbi:MAG: hypothetical protein KGQ80_08600 [Bacteroidetes bacterium]|nr:hypothetical protein [Bacteroidota bacterium]